MFLIFSFHRGLPRLVPGVILLQVFNKQFWFQGILEPLTHLERSGKISMGLGIIVIDGLCEAEHHRPDYGDTIASFFCKQINNFPSWLKVVVTVRSSLSDICRVLPFHRIRWKSYIVLKARIFYKNKWEWYHIFMLKTIKYMNDK